MPNLSNGTILLGFALGFGIWVVARRIWGRRLFVPLALALGVALAYGIVVLGQVLSAAIGPVLTRAFAATGLPPLTVGAVFIGLWFSLLALSLVRGQRFGRIGTVALGLSVFLATAYGVPPLMDRLTGSYQAASLRADVTACTRGMTGQVQPREATNICDETIVVGLCLPGETNPEPCAQSIVLGPGETARLDPGDARLSSVPGNPGGLTVVACRPPDRPSRWGNPTGRGYRGVCLPPA